MQLHESTTESSSFVTLLARSSAAESGTRISPQGALYAHSVNRLTGTVTIYAVSIPSRYQNNPENLIVDCLFRPEIVLNLRAWRPLETERSCCCCMSPSLW